MCVVVLLLQPGSTTSYWAVKEGVGTGYKISVKIQQQGIFYCGATNLFYCGVNQTQKSVVKRLLLVKLGWFSSVLKLPPCLKQKTWD